MKYIPIILIMLLAGCTQYNAPNATPEPVAHFNYVYKSTGTIERVQRKHFVIPYLVKTNIQHRVIK